MKNSKILVVGSFVMDLIVSTQRFPQSGETVLGVGYQTAPGGKGANQAVQAARLGADVTMVGKVGDDVFGRELLQSASASGVDISHVAISNTSASAVGNVQLELGEGKSANRIIVVPGANMDITPEDVGFLENEIGKFDMVMLQLEIPMEINCLIARWAKDKGVPVMLNCAPIAPIPEQLLACLTYMSPNEHEAQILTGITLESDDDIKTAIQKMKAMGIMNALITLGERGVAYEGADGKLLFSPALKGLTVKDTTAAGDSFVGAFCTAVCSGLDMEHALCFANHTAGITVCRMGAQPSLPVLDEVLALMAQRGVDTRMFQNVKECLE